MTRCLFEQLEREADLLIQRANGFLDTQCVPLGTLGIDGVFLEDSARLAWIEVRNLLCVVMGNAGRLAMEAQDAELGGEIAAGATVVRHSSVLATALAVRGRPVEPVLNRKTAEDMGELVREALALGRAVLTAIERQRQLAKEKGA